MMSACFLAADLQFRSDATLNRVGLARIKLQRGARHRLDGLRVCLGFHLHKLKDPRHGAGVLAILIGHDRRGGTP